MKSRLVLLGVLLLAIVVPMSAQDISSTACEAPTTFDPIRALSAVDAARVLELDGDLQGAANAYTQALKLSVIPSWPVYQARAQSWRWLGEFEMALNDINCGIGIAPWDLSLHRDRGILYFITRENKLAEEDFRLVLSLLPDDTEANFLLGLILVQNEDYEEAIERLTEVEAAYSGNAYFYSRRAWANYYIGQYEAAIADSSRSIKLGLIADVDETYEIRALALDSAQDYENAIDEWTRLIELNPDDVQWYSRRGQSYLNAKQYEEAIADFTHLLEHRDQTYGYYWRGLAYIGQKSFDLALADFDRIDKLDPGALEGYIGRAQIYAAMRNRERAIEEITAAIQVHPESAGLYSYRAGLHLQQRDFEAALTDYNTLFELEPPTAFSYYARATVYFYRHDYEQVLDDLSEAIALDAEFSDAYSMRGIANFLLENYDRAEADIDRAQELSPLGMSMMTWRGYYYTYLRQDYEQAIASYTDAIQLMPRRAGGYVSRGAAYLQLGDFGSASADANRALELRPNEIFPYYTRVRIFLEMGDFDTALKTANWMIEQFPDEASAYLARATVYSWIGRETEMLDDIAITRGLQTNTNGEIELLLGKFYQSTGNHTVAAYFLEQALDISFLPSAESYALLGQSYDALGRYEEALATYQRYLRMTQENADPAIVERAAQLEAGEFERTNPQNSSNRIGIHLG